jgi:hypothetical protein
MNSLKVKISCGRLKTPAPFCPNASAECLVKLGWSLRDTFAQQVAAENGWNGFA